MWTLGNSLWCTKCGGYATIKVRKLAKGCTNVIEKCGENALRWLKEPEIPDSATPTGGTVRDDASMGMGH